MLNLNQPVTAIDATTSYYGKLKTNNTAIQRTLDKGYANMDANLLNEGDDHKATQGDMMATDRMKAMARRMGKVY